MSKLTVYSSNGCAGCVAVVQHLERIGVGHVTVKIDEDSAAMEFFKKEGHRTVPQVYTPDGRVLAGSLMELLKLPSGVLDVFKTS